MAKVLSLQVKNIEGVSQWVWNWGRGIRLPGDRWQSPALQKFNLTPRKLAFYGLIFSGFSSLIHNFIVRGKEPCPRL